jgi:osomolarity two-component system sensor histidine kinase TcsA
MSFQREKRRSPRESCESEPDAGLSHSILAHTPAPTVILDASLTIRHASKSYFDLSHHAPEDIIGANIYDFVCQKPSVLDVETAQTAIDAAIASRKVYTIPHIPGEGGTFWSVRTIPISEHDGLHYIVFEFENTTHEYLELVKLHEQVNTNETFRILVETVKDYAIFLLDTEGHVVTWNAGAQLVKGYTKKDIIGKHFSTFYGEEDRLADKPGKELAIALREGKVEDEGWRYRKDGTKFWANVVITPVYRNNDLIGFSKVTRDLTERRAAETRLISAYEETAKLKSEFLANMSHEIRTPMHGMLSALTLLMDSDLDSDQRELTDIIKDSGGVLLHVINDILDYSKLTCGSFPLSSDVVCIADIIRSIARHFQGTMTSGTRLETFLDSRIPKALEGDPLRFRQIVQNLVSNAIKFTDHGSIHIDVSLAKQEDNSLTVLTAVADTGIGVPQHAVGSLFTPFTQFDNSATKRYEGTGLGLSICKTLTELMGGTIGFRPNMNGQGSVFWFTAKLRQFPGVQFSSFDEQPQAVTSAPVIAPSTETKQFPAGKRVLLAEDNNINQRVMFRMLKSLGIDSVDAATDGMQALSLVKQAQAEMRPYDLVLMDINMPLCDGVRAASEIRDAGILVPIIAITANALKGQAEAYLAKGMNGYIPKPIDRQLLVRLLMKIL